MRLTSTEAFFTEQQKYRLRYTCESCVHFDADTERCSHGWPNREHREAYYQKRPDRIVFCKEFELG